MIESKIVKGNNDDKDIFIGPVLVKAIDNDLIIRANFFNKGNEVFAGVVVNALPDNSHNEHSTRWLSEEFEIFTGKLILGNIVSGKDSIIELKKQILQLEKDLSWYEQSNWT